MHAHTSVQNISRLKKTQQTLT